MKMQQTQFKYLKHDKDPWLLAEDIPDIEPLFCQIWLNSFVNGLAKTIGINYKKVISVHRGYHQKYYFGKQDSFALGEHIVNLIKQSPAFGERINKEIISHANKLNAFLMTFKKKHMDELMSLYNKQLWELIEEYRKIHTEAYPWFWLPPASDNFHNNFTIYLQNYLKTKTTDLTKLNEYFVKLTNTGKKSVVSIELEDFLQLALKIQADSSQLKLFKTQDADAILQKLKPKIKQLIENHWEKYHHVKYNFLGTQGIYTVEDYINNLEDLFNSNINIDKKLKDEHEKPVKEKKEKEELFKQLNIDEKHQKIFNVFGDFMITKVYRRDIQIKGLYLIENLFLEAARRLGIDLDHIRFMLYSEIKEALLNGKIDNFVINQRTKLCVYYAEKGKEAMFHNREAELLSKQFEEKIEDNITELKGMCACMGKAKGTVKIINNPAEIKKMNKGDILVSIATNPDLVPAMEKAAAILTDYGGVTSHAAIVSRELGVPCVIGLQKATKVFKDGDLVEVDATNGVVRKIK